MAACWSSRRHGQLTYTLMILINKCVTLIVLGAGLIITGHAIRVGRRPRPVRRARHRHEVIGEHRKRLQKRCQDSPHRLGIAGQGRPLSGASTGGSGLRGLAMGG
jgi:hypothetical protein